MSGIIGLSKVARNGTYLGSYFLLNKQQMVVAQDFHIMYLLCIISAQGTVISLI